MKNLSFLIAAVVVLPAVVLSQGGMTMDGERTSKPTPIKPRLVPFFAMSKECGFPILRADKKYFNEMESLLLTVTKEMKVSLARGSKVVQLSYGYKGSGVGSIYMTKKQGALTAESALKPLIDKKILKDRQYFKGWGTKAVTHPTLLILVSGTSPEVLAKLSGTMK